VCKNQSSRYYPRPFRITHTTAVLLRDCCAIYDLPPSKPAYTIHHTILVMAISGKGSVAGDHLSRDIGNCPPPRYSVRCVGRGPSFPGGRCLFPPPRYSVRCVGRGPSFPGGRCLFPPPRYSVRCVGRGPSFTVPSPSEFSPLCGS